MTIRDLITKFKDGATTGHSASVYIQGDVLYSYGTHFPMAIRGYSTFFVNKDKYSRTTSKQQTWTRSILGEYILMTTEQMKEMV